MTSEAFGWEGGGVCETLGSSHTLAQQSSGSGAADLSPSLNPLNEEAASVSLCHALRSCSFSWSLFSLLLSLSFEGETLSC